MNSKGQRYRRQFEHKEALQWEADSKARLLRGEPLDMGSLARREAEVPHTLGELIDHVYSTHWAPMAGGSVALANARQMLHHMGANLSIGRVTTVEIDRASAALLKDGNSPATVNRKVAALSKAFSIARDAGIISTSPRMSKYRESEHRIRRLTPQEEAWAVASFDHVGQLAMADYIHLSLDTGLRQGEVLALLWQIAFKVAVRGRRHNAGIAGVAVG